jgi:hypothetical protein
MRIGSQIRAVADVFLRSRAANLAEEKMDPDWSKHISEDGTLSERYLMFQKNINSFIKDPERLTIV